MVPKNVRTTHWDFEVTRSAKAGQVFWPWQLNWKTSTLRPRESSGVQERMVPMVPMVPKNGWTLLNFVECWGIYWFLGEIYGSLVKLSISCQFQRPGNLSCVGLEAFKVNLLRRAVADVVCFYIINRRLTNINHVIYSWYMRQDFQTGLGHSLYCKCQSVGPPESGTN